MIWSTFVKLWDVSDNLCRVILQGYKSLGVCKIPPWYLLINKSFPYIISYREFPEIFVQNFRICPSYDIPIFLSTLFLLTPDEGISSYFFFFFFDFNEGRTTQFYLTIKYSVHRINEKRDICYYCTQQRSVVKCNRKKLNPFSPLTFEIPCRKTDCSKPYGPPTTHETWV